MLFKSNRFRLAAIFTVALCGFLISSNTTFANPRAVNVISRSAAQGSTFPLTIQLNSDGNEIAVSFTLNFEQAKLTYVSAAIGNGAPAGCTLTVNPNNVATGRLGVLLDCPTAFTAGFRNMVVVTFTAAAGVTGVSPVGFTCSGPTLVTPCSASDAQANLLTTPFNGGNVTFTPTAADVSIGGRVTLTNGQGFRGAEVYLQDAAGNRRVSITSSLGYYQFDNVESGQTYVIGISSKRYHFEPRTISVEDSLTDVDFMAQNN